MKESKYDKIDIAISNINYNGGTVSITEDEKQELINAVIKQKAYEANIGLFVDRIEFNQREKAFHLNWMKENRPDSGINNGNGILQDLFINQLRYNKVSLHMITDHERMIVATVIQWLGSNCGMAFLEETLKTFGKKISDI